MEGTRRKDGEQLHASGRAKGGRQRLEQADSQRAPCTDVRQIPPKAMGKKGAQPVSAPPPGQAQRRGPPKRRPRV